MEIAGVSRSWLAAVVTGLSLLSMSAPASWAQSTVRYVDNITTCNKLVPCYATVQSALTAAAAGDTVNVFAGVYKEALTIDTQTGLKLQAQSASQRPVIAAPTGAGPALTITASTVQVLNLMLRGDDTVILDRAETGTVLQNNIIRSMTPTAAAVSLASSNAVARGNELIAGGIVVGAATSATVASNQITQAGGDGIALLGTRNSIVQLNVVRAAGAGGIALRGAVTGNTVQDNVVTSSGLDGILTTGDGAPFGANTIRRNTAIESGRCDINDTYVPPSAIAPDTWQSNRFATKCGAATK